MAALIQWRLSARPDAGPLTNFVISGIPLALAAAAGGHFIIMTVERLGELAFRQLVWPIFASEPELEGSLSGGARLFAESVRGLETRPFGK